MIVCADMTHQQFIIGLTVGPRPARVFSGRRGENGKEHRSQARRRPWAPAETLPATDGRVNGDRQEAVPVRPL